MKKLTYAQVLAREERILKAYCEEEGFDYASMSDAEKIEHWFCAEELHDHLQEENGQFGLGA